MPGRVRAGAVEEDALVSTGLDLMATCLAYAGVEQPAHCLGLSLRGPAEGGTVLPREHVYAENQVSVAVVGPRWKYVRYDHGAGREQLYDLLEDPGEKQNFAEDQPAVLEELRGVLDAEVARHKALALRQD
jgi:arylsulfatase A-like enzyme